MPPYYAAVRLDLRNLHTLTGTFDVLSWKLTNRLLPPRGKFTPFVGFSTPSCFRVMSACSTDRQTDERLDLSACFSTLHWWRSSGVATGVRGSRPHRATLAKGRKTPKITKKNSRENSDCKFHMCLRARKTKRYGQRVPITWDLCFKQAL